MTKHHDDLERQFDRCIDTYSGSGAKPDDPSPVRAMGLLGKAIIRLDRTSARLSLVNILLGVAILVAAVVQIYLMLRGK